MARFFLLILTVFAFSCTGPKDLSTEGFTKAVVVKYEVEACGFVLQLENGKILQPSKTIETKFSKDQLPVWVKYQILKKQSPNICMAGESADLLEIKLRK